MKTINEKISIIKKNSFKEKKIIGGIIITSLMLAISMPNQTMSSEKKETTSIDHEVKNYFDTEYLSLLSNAIPAEYDQRFRNIFFNAEVVIENEKYDITEFFMVELEDGSTHLININNPTIDIVTKEEISDDYDLIDDFRNTTTFWNLYKAGKIKNNEIIIDSSLKEYTGAWDRESHEEILELSARNEAERRTRTHFGR